MHFPPGIGQASNNARLIHINVMARCQLVMDAASEQMIGRRYRAKGIFSIDPQPSSYQYN